MNNVTGAVNVSGGSAQFASDAGVLDLGSLDVAGDPTFFNIGNIVIAGNITAGQSLAILATGNITAAKAVVIRATNSLRVDRTYTSWRAATSCRPARPQAAPTIPPGMPLQPGQSIQVRAEAPPAAPFLWPTPQ